MDYGFTLKCPNAECGYEDNYEVWQKYIERIKEMIVINEGVFICPKCKGIVSGSEVFLKLLKNESETQIKGIINIDDEQKEVY